MAPELILEAASFAATLVEKLTGSPLADLAVKLLGLLSAAWGATGKPPGEFDGWVAKWRDQVREQMEQDNTVEDELAKGPRA